MLFNQYSLDEIVLAEEQLTSFIKEELLSIQLDQLPCSSDRVVEVEDITEEFFTHFGQYPNSKILYYLSNYILLSDLKNGAWNKSGNPDSFLSPVQLRRRKRHEHSFQQEMLDKKYVQNVHNIATAKFTGNFEDV